jgi:hypothetical protein
VSFFSKIDKTGFEVNMRISTMKIKTMAFQGKNHIKCKIATDNKTTELL